MFGKNTITEHNTIELNEIRALSRNTLRRIRAQVAEIVYARLAFRHLKGIVACSGDFLNHQFSKVKYRIEKSIVISNGIDVSKVSTRTPEKESSDVITICFAANVSTWHGLDRFLSAYAAYPGDEEFLIYLLGDHNQFRTEINRYDFSDTKIKTLITPGHVVGKVLDDYFDSADVALGSLGLHRLGISQGTPLKHREYISRGIPFIFSGDDVDIRLGCEIDAHVLRFPANDRPLDIAALVDFCRKQKHLRVECIKTFRSYAEKRLDWSIKAAELKRFLEE